MNPTIKIYSKSDPDLALSVVSGHFASDRFHVNYYIDMTMLKSEQIEAEAVAKAMLKSYVSRIDLGRGTHSFDDMFENMSRMFASKAPIETIICMDGCEVIGAYVARELSNLGTDSLGNTKPTFIISPEFDAAGQMVVRDNIRHMIKGKHVLVVLATAMSGRTIEKSLRCIMSYGGIIEGISVIFSVVDEIGEFPVNSVFHVSDLPDFMLAEPDKCPLCSSGAPLDAIVNSYGYSEL